MGGNSTPDKQGISRDEQGRFLEGVSGNPNGRPKKGQTLTDIAKEILDEELPSGVTRKVALMKKVAALAYEGNETMIKLLWNYIDGMPVQKTKLEVDNISDVLDRLETDYDDLGQKIAGQTMADNPPVQD